MNTPLATPGASGAAPLINALIETLYQEAEALSLLGTAFDGQHDALRGHDAAGHQEALDRANEALHALGRLRATRERQTRLLGRVLQVEAEEASLTRLAEALAHDAGLAAFRQRLLEARTLVRSRALESRRACENLDFALRYAVSLGRELVQAMQHLEAPPAAGVYTATGDAPRTTTPRSLVNRVG